MQFWAKTVAGVNGQDIPGISVHDHCLNVGCVAEQLYDALSPGAKALLPVGSVTLAALHDIGKITLGFQAKCPSWLLVAPIDDLTRKQCALAVSDHALVSQYFLQDAWGQKKGNLKLWAVAVGAHHGKPKGRPPLRLPAPEALPELAQQARLAISERLIGSLGALPTTPPDPSLAPHHSDVWLLAGLITVADWIGSNEAFFSPECGQDLVETRRLASRALDQIGWPGGRLRPVSFAATFGFGPNSVQQALLSAAQSPGLIIVEAPMGCGKTEAALAAAQQLIAAGHHHGIYFALPTQVTSNRIHRRVAHFLSQSLDDPARLRLAHGNSWLEADSDLQLRASFTGGMDDAENPGATITEARSWFASAKHALLAPYGVGTIDQALQGMVTVKHFFVRRFALAGKVVILDEIHSYDVYTGALVAALVRELIRLGCTVIVLSATLTEGRRRELLSAAASEEVSSPCDYPLISVGRPHAPVVHLTTEALAIKHIHLRAEAIEEDAVVAELIARAEVGQHVLWIRNTVVEAQQAFRHIRGDLCAGGIKIGLLHSRFPIHRRAELEGFWLDHLGRARPVDGPGSILIATQVVEQSVDIDLDFIVTDLAPTDMLFQRMGRLWRHPRTKRAGERPEFWVRLPATADGKSTGALKKSLGRAARVYAPWVLLRAAGVFAGRTEIVLPVDIRPMLEATYAPPQPAEPTAWHALHADLEKEKAELSANAEAAMLVFGRPLIDPDSDEAPLTRRKGPPTVAVLLLRQLEVLPQRRVQLTALDGTQMIVSEHEWQLDAARFLHRWLVKAPRWQVPATTARSRWLALHVPCQSTWACVREDGRLLFADALTTAASYHTDFGIFSEKNTPHTKPLPSWNDDDEFDY